MAIETFTKHHIPVLVALCAKECGVPARLVEPLSLNILMSGSIALDSAHPTPTIDERNIIKMMVVGEVSGTGYNISKRNFNIFALAGALMASSPDDASARSFVAMLVLILGVFSVQISKDQAAVLLALKRLEQENRDPSAENVVHKVRAITFNTDFSIDDLIEIISEFRKMGVRAREEQGLIVCDDSVLSLPV